MTSQAKMLMSAAGLYIDLVLDKRMATCQSDSERTQADSSDEERPVILTILCIGESFLYNVPSFPEFTA